MAPLYCAAHGPSEEVRCVVRHSAGSVTHLDGPATELDRLRQHADVLFRTDASGSLTALNEDGDDVAPRVFLARGRTTHLISFRDDVPAATAAACRAIAVGLLPWSSEPSIPSLFEPLRTAVGSDAPVTFENRGPAFRFGEPVRLALDADALLIDGPVAGVVQDGWVVAACYSARKTRSAFEAGVDTEEAYRGRGYAPLVVAAWKDAVERIGGDPSTAPPGTTEHPWPSRGSLV